jgi:YidC/Oxa1 family membrane protein insertase
MYVFPVMFAVFGINFPVGVLVYWLTTNVWTMGQQMYVIHNNPTPGSKAQAAYLERLTKHVTHHGRIRRRSEKAIVKAIVAKGRERNEFERKFINGLSKAGLAAQADGTVAKGEAVASVATLEDGVTAAGAPKRQQPKRQSKAQRQSGGPKAAGDSGSSSPSLSKSDDLEDAKPEDDKPEDDKPEDAKPGGAAKKATSQPGNSSRSRAQSGRKGPQRPKSPTKK